jgi:hypothetical protein
MRAARGMVRGTLLGAIMWVAGIALAHAAGMPVPGVSAHLAAHPPYQCVTNYYVDPVNGSHTNPGTLALPWISPTDADDGYPNTPTPGECVNLASGTYPVPSTLIFAHGGDKNTATGFVTYRSMTPGGAHLIAEPGIDDGGNGDVIMIWAPYLIFDGLEIDGNNGLANGSGIDGCANGGQPGNIADHFVALNNMIHDVGGSGLSSCSADKIEWWNNVVYNTSSTNLYQVSALNIWQPQATPDGVGDGTAYWGIRIGRNVVHDNGEGPSIPGNHTDGNGIIIDTTLDSFACPTCGNAYTGQILVIGNSSYNNGGGGVHVFLSANATVANNTIYNSYTDALNNGTARGECSDGGSTGITWLNNICYAVSGKGILAYNAPIATFPVNFGGAAQFPDSGTWAGNLTFGGAPNNTTSTDAPASSNNLLGVDPMLTDPAHGNFKPLPGSPVIGAGVAVPHTGEPAHPDIGAY